MTALLNDHDAEVVDTIEDAARAACKVLDEVFPGHERAGITSNFQGLLVEVLAHMLKGRSVLDGRRGAYVALPQLIIDETFFGAAFTKGDTFLVTKDGAEIWGAVGSAPDGGCAYQGRDVLALCPDSNRFRPIAEIGDAWTSVEAACAAALAYLRGQGSSLEEAREYRLKVQPVVADRSRERGYVLLDVALRLAA
jgi:hypothetical protein